MHRKVLRRLLVVLAAHILPPCLAVAQPGLEQTHLDQATSNIPVASASALNQDATIEVLPAPNRDPSQDLSAECVRLPPVDAVIHGDAVIHNINAEIQVLSQGVPVPSPAFDRQHLFEAAAKGDRLEEQVSLTARDTSVGTVLSLIAEQHGLNIVTGDQVNGSISVSMKDVPLKQALDSILTTNGYTWNLQGNVLVVSAISTTAKLSPMAQGRQLQVFDLSFVAAADVDRVVKGLLSPVGQSFIAESAPDDRRRTCEQIVVEDLPEYLARVNQYLSQVDQPPRQVVIEAHILEVELEDDCRHGVNLDSLLRLSSSQLNFQSAGFADENASPAFLVGLEGADLTGLIEVLQSQTDAKTLASTKVSALNGQEARIQIGSSLGYFVTTTTQTSSLQSVDFLDVGVVLRVTPNISQDGRVVMTIKPEVSGGRINPAGLPEEDTTEVETTVMLRDGQAMVIGGLIQEELISSETKVPYLGDLWLLGKLFKRRIEDRKRSEIIVALVPRVLACDTCSTCEDEVEISRVKTQLFTKPLDPIDRTAWEPALRPASYAPVSTK